MSQAVCRLAPLNNLRAPGTVLLLGWGGFRERGPSWLTRPPPVVKFSGRTLRVGTSGSAGLEGRANAEVLKYILPTSFPKVCAAPRGTWASLCSHCAWGWRRLSRPSHGWSKGHRLGLPTTDTNHSRSWKLGVRHRGPVLVGTLSLAVDCGPLALPSWWEGPGSSAGSLSWGH